MENNSERKMLENCCGRKGLGYLVALLFLALTILLPSASARSDSEKTPNKPSQNAKESVKKDKKEENKDKKNPIASMSAEDLLNLATETKLNANGLLDYTKVILYCEKAEERGLSDDNLEFCRQLRISTQLQRGLIIAQYFMQDNLKVEKLPLEWIRFRKMALDDLESGGKESENNAMVQLVIGRLHLLPQGNTEKAKQALDMAIKVAADEPNILVQALKYRAEIEQSPKKVMDYLDRALKLQPENDALQADLAEQWLKIKEFDKALKFIDQALSKKPESKDYKKIKAYILAALDKKDEAEKLFSETVSAKDSILEQVERADFLSEIGKTKAALDIFTALINKYKSPGLFYLRAAIYAQNKQYKEALDDLNSCMGSDPNFTDAIRLKGFIYLEMDNFSEAVKNFEILLAKFPNDPMKATHLAYAQAKKGDLAKSLETINKSLKNNKDNRELLRNRADIYLMFGKWDEAIKDYSLLLKLFPEDSGVLNNYSWLMATSPEKSIRNGKKALEFALKACELTWYKESHILSTLAAAYAELGQFDKAREWSAKAIMLGEKEKMPRIEDLRAELESYKKNKPWREIPEQLRAKTKKDAPKADSPKKEAKPEVKKDAPKKKS